ncbi:MAG TPA: 50S ribosomal protein L29 [Candidatus Thermoplasmatota archaeon]|nr:50S ribosomal protein L29 [Candidatus Thermoplasmatota archaeon]
MSIKSRDIRTMKRDERVQALDDARKDLMHERGVAAMGGAPANPGKIRDLRTTIARILTAAAAEKGR